MPTLDAKKQGFFKCRHISQLATYYMSILTLAQSRFITAQFDASISWKDVREMIELWKGPFAIKGVMSADDARHAADIGATAVIVSNHGGRQLDGAAATVEVLPEIAKAVGSKINVILEGGIDGVCTF